MKISISGVCERDMDLFLIEELVADHALLVWLFNRCELGAPLLDKISFIHSAVVGNGESDVEIRAQLSDGSDAVILIENKVAASFQPQQAERYRERAKDYCWNKVAHAAVTLLFAPASYIGDDCHFHGFDVTLTYEELRDWICNRGEPCPRSRYKEMLLKAAIEKSGRGFSTLDNAVSSFQRRYREVARAMQPDLKLNEPKGNPSGSTFIQFGSNGFPGGLRIVHKLDRGFIDLEISGWGKRLHQLKEATAAFLNEGMAIEKAKGSAAIRLQVACLNVSRSADDQIEAIKEGISAAGSLQRWVWLNQEALESLLRP